MKHVLMLAALAIALASQGIGQIPCRVDVKANISLMASQLLLADLLPEDTCPKMLSRSAHVLLGKAPLEGSVRVLRGDFIESLLRKIGNDRPPALSLMLQVPERISIHRGGPRASCREVVKRLMSGAGALPAADCGAGESLARDAGLRLIREVRDPVLNSWVSTVRCARPSDCVPFAIRAPSRLDASESDLRASVSASPTPIRFDRSAWPHVKSILSDRRPVVRPGESVSVLWDEGGIRSVMPAVCLDSGGMGDEVRARFARGNEVRAVVTGPGNLVKVR